MLRTQLQIVERQLAVQKDIEEEMEQVDALLQSGEGSNCSEGEHQRRSLRARLAILNPALERTEVRNSKQLLRYLTWQQQIYQNTLATLRIQSEKEILESIPAKVADAAPQFEPVSQQQIDEVLNLSPQTGFGDFFTLLQKQSKPGTITVLIEAMEAEIMQAQHKPRSKEWEGLTETQKQVQILEEKIFVCEKAIALGVAKKDPQILRYALRAKECYTNHLDALKMDVPSM